MGSKQENIRELYLFCRNMPEAALSESPEKVAEALSSIRNDHLDTKGAQSFLVAAKIAREISEEEFFAFMETQEVPPIKLTETEMNALKGGWIFTAAAAVAAGGWAIGKANHDHAFDPNKGGYWEFLMHPIDTMRNDWNKLSSQGSNNPTDKVRPFSGGAIDDAQRINDMASGTTSDRG